MSDELIYMGSPYTARLPDGSPDIALMTARYEAVRVCVCEYLNAGRNVFSPIVYTRQFEGLGLPVDWPFWERFDLPYVDRCTDFHALMLPGWYKSAGLRGESQRWISRGSAVHYQKPSDAVMAAYHDALDRAHNEALI